MLSRLLATAILATNSALALTNPHQPSHNCTLPSPLTNTSSTHLPSLFAPATHPQNPIILDQIRNTLSLYPSAVDSKFFASLSQVFTPDAVANYSSPLNIFSGLPNIQKVLEESLAPVTTQHFLGTQVIELLGDGEAGGCEEAARSVTYFRAAHFGKGVYEGEALYAYGQYRDVLVNLGEGVGWRVRERTLAYMGPFIGNISIYD